MLLFKKKFLDAIRTGDKTQTIRLWKFRRMRPGQQSYIPGVGYIDITAVDEVALDQLTEDDARRDGFSSADALRHEIGVSHVFKPPGRGRLPRLSPAWAPRRRRRQLSRGAAAKPQAGKSRQTYTRLIPASLQFRLADGLWRSKCQRTRLTPLQLNSPRMYSCVCFSCGASKICFVSPNSTR